MLTTENYQRYVQRVGNWVLKHEQEYRGGKRELRKGVHSGETETLKHSSHLWKYSWLSLAGTAVAASYSRGCKEGSLEDFVRHTELRRVQTYKCLPEPGR